MGKGKGRNGPAVVAIVGAHNSGKTLLIERLIPLLKSKGYRVGTVKHTCHDELEVDEAGKDSFRHRKAGADSMAISSNARTIFMKEFKGELSLDDVVGLFDSQDLVLVEGCKGANLPKVFVHREGLGNPEWIKDPGIFAVYSETPLESNVPVFSSVEIPELIERIEKEVAKQPCFKDSTI
jgi:molybdopterin-guanine dinucleotide biosynthesis protein B